MSSKQHTLLQNVLEAMLRLERRLESEATSPLPVGAGQQVHVRILP
jgi:hypothetical protein